MLSRSIALTTISTLLAACAESPRLDHERAAEQYPVSGAPLLRAVGSVELVEVDTLFLGHPVSFAIDPEDGTFYVADVLNNRAVRYSREGVPLVVYGSPGSGPEEIRQIAAVFVADTMVAVVDAGLGMLKLFIRDTGAHLRSTRYVGQVSWFIASARDTAWIGARGMDLKTSVLAWDISTDSMVRFASLPDEYAEYPNLTRFTELPVVKWSDSLLVGFGPLNGVIVFDTQGNALDTLVIPVRRRRGSTAAAVRESDGRFAPLMNGVTTLVGVSRHSDDHFMLVHYDNHVLSETVPRITTTVHLSLLAGDLESACVDQLVPIDSDAQPVVQFRGDTLFVLLQTVTDTTSATMIKAFQVEASGCEWIHLDRESLLFN